MMTQVFEPVAGLDSQAHPIIEEEKEVYLRQDTDEMQLITEDDLSAGQAPMQETEPVVAEETQKEEPPYEDDEENNVVRNVVTIKAKRPESDD